VIVVTEKATNNILVYTVEGCGYVDGPKVYASVGMTPFGFGFGKRSRLFVSEAFGGAPDASAVSSYIVSPEGDLAETIQSAPSGLPIMAGFSR
jgi:hypothetical protein